MTEEEEEMLAHAMTLMKYCKSKKNCKGCSFWNNDLLCLLDKRPRRWKIYGFETWFENRKKNEGDKH